MEGVGKQVGVVRMQVEGVGRQVEVVHMQVEGVCRQDGDDEREEDGVD